MVRRETRAERRRGEGQRELGALVAAKPTHEGDGNIIVEYEHGVGTNEGQ